MTTRTTQKDLEQIVSMLNIRTGNSEKPYTYEGKERTAHIGCYMLDGAYGGWKLVQLVNDGGGQRDVLPTGYTTKKDLYLAIRCFLNGVTLTGDK